MPCWLLYEMSEGGGGVIAFGMRCRVAGHAAELGLGLARRLLCFTLFLAHW